MTRLKKALLALSLLTLLAIGGILAFLTWYPAGKNKWAYMWQAYVLRDPTWQGWALEPPLEYCGVWTTYTRSGFKDSEIHFNGRYGCKVTTLFFS